MKRYYNAQENKWYIEGDIITHPVPGGVFSGIPTEEQLLSWGYVEYIDPERTLAQAKQERIEALMEYDSSDDVNSFSINGVDMWIEPAGRDNYMLTLQSAKRLGVTSISFLGQTIAVDDAIAMIDAVNVYAMQCVAVTDSHRAAINALQSIADVDRYDFTVGYPTKLSF